MINIILYFVLSVALGITKAIVDTLSFRKGTNIFPSSWQIDNSWRNKWKNGDPNQGEKFWGSSRWFVPFTDAFHFTGMINHIIIFLMIGIFHFIQVESIWSILFLYLVGGYVLSRTVFHVFYTYIFIKNNVNE